jgi:hypothetical protein
MADARFARIQAMREEQAAQVQAEMEKMPALPPVSEMVVPARLFAGLGRETTASQVVDAAAARFLQRPLSAEQKGMLVQSLGSEPLKLGRAESDDRVRQMIGLMLSTPDYQVE